MKVLSSFIFLLFLMTATAHADRPSVHGMVVFGSAGTTYASHLPMFHSPHDRQLILKITLKDVSGSSTLAAYAAAKESGKTLFTLEPQTMDLEPIAQGTQATFSASLYDGHFERGGQSLGQVKVSVEKIVFSSKLDGHAPKPGIEKYLVFGENGTYFAAHLIESKPSFDVILQVGRPYKVLVFHCRTRACTEPTPTWITDASLPVMLTGPGNAQAFQDNLTPPLLGDLLNGITNVKRTLYVEEGDLSH